MGPSRGPGEKADQKVKGRPGRVPTSCAECRRLKLRCDRNVPCETCVKRGCGPICPQGSLTTGKGNRMILLNTEQLHERNEQLSSRIRELEDALKVLQADVSDRPHPLLHDSSQNLDLAPRAKPTPPKPPPAPVLPRIEECRSEDETILDAFGTLTIGSDGETNFIGKTARSEYLISVPTKLPPPTSPPYPRLAKQIVDAGLCEVDTPVDEDLAKQVFDLLPPLSDAIHLCDVYLTHGKYLFTPVPRTQLFDGVLGPIYRPDHLTSFRWHHAMALAFSIFALGALLDPSKPSLSTEAKEYHHLSRVALRISHPIRETTLDSIQALLHMTHFLQLSNMDAATSRTTWSLVGFALRLGYRIGLHLNGARWKLCDETIQRRSRIFWETFVLDTWISFGFGRPPSINPAFVDCALPKDTDEAIHGGTSKEMGFHSWVWQFTRLLHNVMATAFGAKIPPYLTILDLDRRIRDFPVPVYLRPPCESCPSTIPESQESPELHMQRWWVLSSKEATLLNLHRPYFVDALRDQPNDSIRHRYSPSVMATYRSAYRLIQGLKVLPCTKVPNLLSRMHLPWSHALSAAIVMCLLVTRATSSSMTSSSLAELDTVAELFEKFAPNCRAAALNLNSVRILRSRAHEAVNDSHSPETASLTLTELERLSGRTYLLSSTGPSNPPQNVSESSSNAGTSSTAHTPIITDEEFALSSETVENLHPTIVQDLKTFDGVMNTSDMPPYHNIFDFPTEHLSQEMPDVQFPETQELGMGDCFGTGSGSHSSQGFPQSGITTPLTLDSTWQSFVEQLGYVYE